MRWASLRGLRLGVAVVLPIGVLVGGWILDFYPRVIWVAALSDAVAVSVALIAWHFERPQIYWSASVAFGIASGIAVAWFVFFDFPQLVIPGNLITKNPSALAQRRNEVRTAAVQAALGVAVVIGAIYTARTFRITREGHFTERLSTAVSQLNQGTDVATGAIVALERLARDSKRDRPGVLELLTSYVRTHAQDPATTRLTPGMPRPRLTADLQAGVTAITRLIPSVEAIPRPLDLSELNLRGAGLDDSSIEQIELSGSDLSGARLLNAKGRGAELTQADLTEAVANNADLRDASLGGALLFGTKLDGAQLRNARLPGVRLSGAFMAEANLDGTDLSNAIGDRDTILERAHLNGATLVGSQFRGSSLRGAQLVGAHLEGANLSGAHLEGTNLRAAHLTGTNLTGAYLSDAELAEALWNLETSWPADQFDQIHEASEQLPDGTFRIRERSGVQADEPQEHASG